jgi:O-acetylhomoserine/O-acetylserine sulfhydrylase-like pyridoxal-dependent enzyme
MTPVEPGADPQTMLLYGDQEQEESSIAPPLYQSVPFAADSVEDFPAMNQDPLPTRAYRRSGNPTQRRLERIVAQLEGGKRRWRRRQAWVPSRPSH